MHTRWSFLYINQSKYLSRQALLFPTWDWRRSYPIKANKLACYQPNSLDAPSRRTKLACHQPASLVCLVCCQPIPPSYLVAWSVLFVINQFLLIITIAFKRGKQHQCRYIRNSVGLLCHFNPLKAVLSDCSHCFQKNWAHQCRCIRNNAGLLCRLISWKQCQSFMSPFPIWRKQYSMMGDHYHHLIITIQTNTSLLTLMYWPVWYQHPIWCRYAEMQRCRYADMHQFPRIKSDTHKVELPIHLGSIVVQVCAWSHRSIFRQSDKLNHGSILYTVRNIVSLLFPPWGSQPWIHETDKHTLHRLYFPGNP